MSNLKCLWSALVEELIKSRLHILFGYKEFMKLNFKVNENVLIPREDTEILVQEAIKLDKKNILDMCTGSGCIAISLAKYVKNARVIGVDVSTKALEIAKVNADLNGVLVEFIKSDLFENVQGKYDLIISNPPYIRTDVTKTLQEEVKREPIQALDGGIDGLDFYRTISNKARNFLNENGYLAFEIGYDEASNVSDILKKYKYKNIRLIKDLSENDRVIIAQKGGVD